MAMVSPLRQSGPQAAVPPLLAVVGRHSGHHLVVAHQDEELLGPGHGGVQDPSGEEHGGSVHRGEDDRPVLYR